MRPRWPQAVQPRLVPGLFVLPSSVELSGADLELASLPRRSYRLRDVLHDALENARDRTIPMCWWIVRLHCRC